MIYTLLAVVFVTALAQDACVPGSRRISRNVFVYECKNHPILGGRESPIGCRDIDKDGRDVTVPFGGDILLAYNPERNIAGFVGHCTKKDNGFIGYNYDGCWAFTLPNDFVKVPIGQWKIVTQFEHVGPRNFSCAEGPSFRDEAVNKA